MTKIFKHLKQALLPEAFDTLMLFFVVAFFNKASFCLGEMTGMLLNNEQCSCYILLVSVWDRRKEILHGGSSVRPTSRQSAARPMALSAMVVECG